MQKPTLGKINFLLQPKLDTYPLPRPGTYPRGAGTPIKDFFFLFNKDIFSNNRVFDFQYGGHSLVIATFRKTATDQYKPRVTLALPTESMGRSGWKCSRGYNRGGGEHSATPGTFCVSTDHPTKNGVTSGKKVS